MLHVENFLSSPALFDDWHNQTIHCCGIVTSNRKGMPKNFGHKMKLKRGDLNTDMESNLTVKVGKNRWSVITQTNMHYPPLEGNFCDTHGTAVKPAIIQDYNRHMRYVGKSDYMTNPYSISRQTLKWTNELFLHLLDVTILNSCIILTSHASNYCINNSHWHWWGT
jgi:hypothetical protein